MRRRSLDRHCLLALSNASVAALLVPAARGTPHVSFPHAGHVFGGSHGVESQLGPRLGAPVGFFFPPKAAACAAPSGDYS
ncbi:hypothetical protein AQ611_19325 [Burkholderia singularis]|nr:hypothetical protein AQ611_19325 [Burkholderia sp. Bp7605]